MILLIVRVFIILGYIGLLYGNVFKENLTYIIGYLIGFFAISHLYIKMRRNRFLTRLLITICWILGAVILDLNQPFIQNLVSNNYTLTGLSFLGFGAIIGLATNPLYNYLERNTQQQNTNAKP